MKKRSLPNSKKKRSILYDKKMRAEERIQYGDMFFNEARYVEAAEFYRKASFAEGMERLRVIAKEEGDSFLFELASKGSEDGQDPRVWEELGKRAFELKKYSHAIRAFRKAGNTALLEQAELEFKGAVHSGKA